MVEKVVGQDALITVSGAGIKSPDDLWNRALDLMGYPASETSGRTNTIGGSVSAEAGGGVSLFGLAKAQAKGTGTAQGSTAGTTSSTTERRGMSQVVEAIANSEYALLVDDFHYMGRDAQEEVAKALKEVARLGVKVITAQVNYRGDDVLRALPELRGRVKAVDMQYWDRPDLIAIARSGFSLLGVALHDSVIARFVDEAARSPQLMQSICLQACFQTGHREQVHPPIPRDISATQLNQIFEATSATSDFRSLVDVLEAGPPTRGTKRITYTFRDGSSGDVYRCVLKALAADPPLLAFRYDNLLGRTVAICKGDPPVGSSVSGTCTQMVKLATEKFPTDRVLDWDEVKGILDLPNPYLLFYLRWSGRLNEAGN
ncbi:MAG TPA: hypothetical protein VHW25_16415 [Steroidobacteraceae bacterium]|nr:hypothetical protein [Steroidobacteraceae bacterium]